MVTYFAQKNIDKLCQIWLPSVRNVDSSELEVKIGNSGTKDSPFEWPGKSRKAYIVDNILLNILPNKTVQLIRWMVTILQTVGGERGGSVVECRTPEREVRGSKPTAAVLCPWARHFTPRKYWLITQEAMAPSRHDWKIVDWDVKPQHNTTQTVGDIIW